MKLPLADLGSGVGTEHAALPHTKIMDMGGFWGASVIDD